MGRLVNPGNELFSRDKNSEIYVDKSLIVSYLNKLYNTNQMFVCVSRARRFGKTMMANLLAAYYSKGCDSRALFENLKLAKHEEWDKYLNSVNVIKIDVNGEYRDCRNKANFVNELVTSVVAELRETFPQVAVPENETIAKTIFRIHQQTDEQFVFLIDEYDVLIRDPDVHPTAKNEYIELLNALFKNDSIKKAISLAYLTGILPILKESVQSKLNNFKEFTMLSPKQLAPYFGFTEEEVNDLCERFDMDKERCREMYDGYIFPKVGHIYNPNSVAQAAADGIFEGYWTKTSKAEAITFYISADLDGIQEDITKLLEGKEIKVNIDTYANDVKQFTTKDDVFTYLIHLGYLAYDYEAKRCRIPNTEIRQEWFDVMRKSDKFNAIYEICNTSYRLMEATEEGDEQALAKALDNAHESICSPLTYNRESSMQSAILMAYLYAKRDYMVFSELTAGSGYADVVFIPLQSGLKAIIIELKKDGDPEEALNQFLQRNYAHALKRHPGKGAILVGISYDHENKKHRCKIRMVEDVKEIWRE